MVVKKIKMAQKQHLPQRKASLSVQTQECLYQQLNRTFVYRAISCRSSAGQRKFAGQRPTFYHCAPQPTRECPSYWCISSKVGALFDNGNKTVRLAEWQLAEITVLCDRELGENMADDELRAMIDEFDHDGDGESM